MLRVAAAASRAALQPRATTVAPVLAIPPIVLHRRHLSSGHNKSNPWPVTKVNTFLNVCPEGQNMVVERLGSLHRVQKPGWFLSVPFFEEIAYCVDMRERTIYYPPQSAITKDNVSVNVGAVIFVRFVDPVKAAYGATDPVRAVKELAQSAMRAAVGEMELDQVFHSRKQVNDRCCSAVGEAAANWGLIVTRHEILDVTPDKHISESLDKQAAAERMRREQVLQAEGLRQATSLESLGVKERLQNESEGHLIRVRNEALAEQTRLELEAEGKARALLRQAEAHAEVLEKIGRALSENGALEAAQLELAREYVKMYGEMGKGSNTILMNERPADVNALLAQARLAMGAVEVDASKKVESLTKDWSESVASER